MLLQALFVVIGLRREDFKAGFSDIYSSSVVFFLAFIITHFILLVIVGLAEPTKVTSFQRVGYKEPGSH